MGLNRGGGLKTGGDFNGGILRYFLARSPDFRLFEGTEV